MANIEYGATVWVNAKMKRKSRPLRRGWSAKFWDVFDFKEPKRGILIGYRTLANGEIEFGDSETPTTFFHKEVVKAALVSLDSKTNPIYVPIDKITER